MADREKRQHTFRLNEKLALGCLCTAMIITFICGGLAFYGSRRINTHGPFINPGSDPAVAFGVEIPYEIYGACSPTNVQMAHGVEAWVYLGHPFALARFRDIAVHCR